MFDETKDGGAVENPDSGNAGEGQAQESQGSEQPREGDPRTYLKNPILDWGEEGTAANATDTPESPAPPDQADDTEGQQEAEPTTDRDEPEKQKILGKFDSPEQLAKSYRELEKRLGQQGQEYGQLKKQHEEMQNRWQEIQDAKKAAEDPTREGPSEEERKAMQEKFMQDFYTNPIDAVRGIAEDLAKSMTEERVKELKQEIEPLQRSYQEQQRMMQLQQQFNEVAQNEDFEQVQPVMNEIMEKHGSMLMRSDQPFEAAYNLAKDRIQAGQPSQDTQTPAQVDPNELLQNEEFVNALLQNEELRNRVIQQYTREVQDSAPPSVIGSQPSRIPATPPDKIKNTGDARNALMRWLESGDSRSQ